VSAPGKIKRGSIVPVGWTMTMLGGLLIFGLSGTVTVVIGAEGRRAHNHLDRKVEIDRILQALEATPEVRKLPDKAKEKLAALSEEQVRLIYTLSMHMARNARTAAADIDLLLITALIVLS